MNVFNLLLKYFGILTQIATVIEGISISSGLPVSSPPINTYLFGVHGSLTLVWTPIAAATPPAPAAAIAAAHEAALNPASAPLEHVPAAEEAPV